MKRIVIMLLIACSATATISAQKKGAADTTPYNVKALFSNILKTWGSPADEVYSVNRNPNTNQMESSVKITYFVANVNTGSVRQNMHAIAEAFMKDESKAYQVLHLSPGNKEMLSLSVYNENGENATYQVRLSENEEMWLLCAKNAENPRLRDAYAIKWTLNDDKSKALGAVYQITSLRPDLYAKNMSAGIFNNGQNATAKTFRIEGRVGDDLTDSLYVVYMAPSAEELNNVADDAFVATMPVVNRRFGFSVDIDKPMVGRIRTVMPDGSLCQLWTNLDFVPGETYHITTHNGYYDGDNDYEQRVGRYSGKSLLNDLQKRGVDDQVFEVIDTIPTYHDNTPTPAPQNQGGAQRYFSESQKAQIVMKLEAVKMNMELIKQTYKSVAGELKSMRDPNKINMVFNQIIKQNKALDAKYKDIIKVLKSTNMPNHEFPNLYKEILKFYTEQSQAISEFYKEYGSYTKSARNAQNYINKLTVKYMNEMTKLMQ